MRKLSVCMIVFLFLFSAAGAQALTLTWNEVLDETYGATVGAYAFADRLAELSGGTMDIDLYINGELGGEDVSMQSLQMGTLDIFRGNASTLPDYGAELIGATGMPYLFRNEEEFEEMAVSPLGQELLDSVEASDCGFVAIAWMVEGPRYLFLTEKGYRKIGSPETFSIDMLHGLSIRVPSTELLENTMDVLGAQPIKIEFSTLNQSLMSGNIDGAENGIIPYVSLGFCKSAPYLVKDAHLFGCGVILVSTSTWNNLTDEQKGWMIEAGKAASDACYAHNIKHERDNFDAVEGMGVKVLQVSDLEKWQAACEPIYDEQSEAVQDIIRRIRAHEYR